MAHLSISLLGSLQIAVNGEPIKEFKSNRTRALLVYLIVESDRPHRRETLAGLLWPEWPDREALNNLRSTLSNLRLAIRDREADPPFLLITRDSIQINPQADIWSDIAEFTRAVGALKTFSPINDELEKALACYRGNFLEGFSLGDSPEFEEWALQTRERLARDAIYALQYVSTAFEKEGNYSRAQTYAWRRLEQDSLDETAHQQLMRLLALSGQRAAALTQYESCAATLEKELGIQPAAATTELYEQIRAGKLAPFESPLPTSPDLLPKLPSFLTDETIHVDIPLFVSREKELASLQGYLDRAVSGSGQVIFVTGEAGSGKTSLIQEFNRRVQAAYPDCCVAAGNCNAYTGIGDPYLPFREILEMLTGKVESRLAAGAITREHACRLWDALPDAVQALVEAGPDLIDNFLVREPLLERARIHSAEQSIWYKQLVALLQQKPHRNSAGSVLQQIDLFEQFTTVMQTLSHRRPMILILDDLQWADLGSISLLFHLGRRLSGNRILLLGAYRPEEVSIVKEGGRHPIEAVINEFHRIYGDLEVNLDLAESQEFINDLLDSEPNHLGPSFRKMLYKQTGGHPLFTVELLRGMQDSGDIAKNNDQYWIEETTLDWDRLPARIEAAIKERINRLPELSQRILSIASVEGEIFTAEVVARALGQNERGVVQNLSGELVRKHRLIAAQAIERLGSKQISHYRFRSYLLQKYLYDRLDIAERTYLHEDVGNILEELYGEQSGEIAIQLARHFQEAGIEQKAIQYLHQASDKAMQMSAYQEAITHITKALDLLMKLPDSPERANQEINLQISLAKASMKDLPTLNRKDILNKARELSQKTGNLSHLFIIMGELVSYHYIRAEYREALKLTDEVIRLAEQIADPLVIAIGHWHKGYILYALGNLSQARAHFEPLISVYRPDLHNEIISLRGSDAGFWGFGYYACSLWCLGYPDQADRYAQEALSLAPTINHDISSIEVLCYAGCNYNTLRRDWLAVIHYSEEMIDIAQEKGFIGWLGTAMAYHGNALSMHGFGDEGIAQTQESINYNDQVNLYLFRSEILLLLAQAYYKSNDLVKALATLDQALNHVSQTGEGFWEAEIYRVKANILLGKNDDVEAEACLIKAIDIAQSQNTKSWELRASTDLARLWQRQGRKEDALTMLSNIYNWFTEGFETKDLLEAKKLLGELGVH